MAGVRAVGPAIGPALPIERPRVADPIAERPSRVAKISQTTALYDSHGTYPTRHLFQIAKTLPEPRPFRGLAVSLSPDLYAPAYAKKLPPTSTIIDRRL